MAKREEEEKGSAGESGTGRWMLTYLDMITLLFGVFVIMYAMSNIDRGKAEAVAESLRLGFQGGYSIFSGPLVGGHTIMPNLFPVGTDRKYMYDKFSKFLAKEIQRNLVVVKEGERGITFQLASDLFFESGSWRLTKDATQVLSHIAKLLKHVNHYISIEGHTDDAPITFEGKDLKADNNWELGALRAISVLRFLQDEGVAPGKMSAQSFAMYRPAVPRKKFNSILDEPESKALNRRVEIVILTDKYYVSQAKDQWK